jgi:hypothetical protein
MDSYDRKDLAAKKKVRQGIGAGNKSGRFRQG